VRKYILFLLPVALVVLLLFQNSTSPDVYPSIYHTRLAAFEQSQQFLLQQISQANLSSETEREKLKTQIAASRKSLKAADLWFRYLEPLAYKKMNGPLPVEWETEVFEKFEPPYKREGAGLTLAEVYLDEPNPEKKVLERLVKESIQATAPFHADSITKHLNEYHHFFLCNRLYLLNLAAIYTTAFECPNTEQVIPELWAMLTNVKDIYPAFNQSFPNTPLSGSYLALYDNMIDYVQNQSQSFDQFDRFTFIKDYVNKLYGMNQELIRQYNVRSRSNMDYALNKTNTSIFYKNLYQGQNVKGIFHRVKDQEILSEIEHVGKLLFYDPILSGNNKRSCVSCHNSTQFFTDTTVFAAPQFDRKTELRRNTPTLVNATFNHLIMADGKHISLQSQIKGVITDPFEMGGNEQDVLRKVLSCSEYQKAFKKFMVHTPQEKEITIEHIASAITLYYSKFSQHYSPFDEAMHQEKPLHMQAIKGFNLFMGKAACATCHFVPQFNGVKPPYVGSEFEVIGVYDRKNKNLLSGDKGRYVVNPATETLHAFRTGTVRNASRTKPYMHNGAIANLDELIDFYDTGGGQGRGLDVPNQTLAPDSLHLSKDEKQQLVRFIESLNEDVPFEIPPGQLPLSKNKTLNTRKVGGEY
jgi:cytochrome c peroxidase